MTSEERKQMCDIVKKYCSTYDDYMKYRCVQTILAHGTETFNEHLIEARIEVACSKRLSEACNLICREILGWSQ